MNDPSQPVRLQLERKLPAAPARVFEAWTKVEQLKKWFAPGEMTVPTAEADVRPGGRFRIAMQEPGGETHVAHGEYREVVANERLVFTWQWEGQPMPETLVTVALEAKDGGTSLTLTHQELPSEELRAQHEQGWVGCLGNLEKALAA